MSLEAQRSIFFALSDTTRLTLVDWLAREGAGTATEFAARLPISRQAVSRHLAELEKAGLVDATKSGRERLYRFDPEPLEVARHWIDERTSTWDRALSRLRTLVEPEEGD